MSWKRHVRPFVPRPLESPTDHIWISDDILNRTLHSFSLCRIQSRHGSSTPGPLEARKRATKRRIVNLAQAGEGRGIDPGFLAGLRGLEQGGRQWQAPDLPASQIPSPKKKSGKKYTPYSIVLGADVVVEPPLLPSWLTISDPVEHTLSPPLPHEPSLEVKPSAGVVPESHPAERTEKQLAKAAHSRALSSDLQTRDLRKEHPRFYPIRPPKSLVQNLISQERNPAIDRHDTIFGKLRPCRTTERIRDLTHELEIDVRATPEFSKRAFRQLFKTNFELGTLIEFLEDSSLNAPEARNLQFLVTWLIQNNAELDVMWPFLKWIRKSTSLGMLSEEEILQVAVITSRLRLYNAAGREDMSRSILITVLEGLLESSIHKIHDLDAHTLDTLLRCISDRPSDVALQDLGATIITSAHESQLRGMCHGIPSFLRSWILSRPTSTAEQAKTFLSYRITKLFKLLERLPDEMAKSSIVNASVRILDPAHCKIGRSSLVENLTVWWSALFKSQWFHILDGSAEWESVKRRLAGVNVDILASYLQAIDDWGKCLFIVDQWFLIRRIKRPFGQREALQKIEKLKALHRANPLTSPFVNMLQMLRYYHIQVAEETTARLLTLLRELEKADTIVEVIKYKEKVRQRMKAETIASAVNDDLYINPRQAYHMFDSYPNLSLEKVPALAESIIMNPYLHPNTALYFRHSRQRVATVSSPTGAHLPRQPDPRLHLLQRMCLAYALAPHLPPRLALRKIHECYITIKRERLGPISSDITQALVQVGIIRPLLDVTWVSTIKLRWILGLVREVEGEKIADEIDQVVYEWRGIVVQAIRERQQGGFSGAELRLQRVQEKYERLWLENGRKVYGPVHSKGGTGLC